MVLERRDLRDDTNSVLCSTGFASSDTISTGIGGMPPGGAPAAGPDPSLQAADAARSETKANSLANRTRDVAVVMLELMGLASNLEENVEKANRYYTSKSELLAIGQRGHNS